MVWAGLERRRVWCRRTLTSAEQRRLVVVQRVIPRLRDAVGVAGLLLLGSSLQGTDVFGRLHLVLTHATAVTGAVLAAAFVVATVFPGLRCRVEWLRAVVPTVVGVVAIFALAAVPGSSAPDDQALGAVLLLGVVLYPSRWPRELSDRAASRRCSWSEVEVGDLVAAAVAASVMGCVTAGSLFRDRPLGGSVPADLVAGIGAFGAAFLLSFWILERFALRPDVSATRAVEALYELAERVPGHLRVRRVGIVVSFAHDGRRAWAVWLPGAQVPVCSVLRLARRLGLPAAAVREVRGRPLPHQQLLLF